jgi:hypothetical protein
MMAERAFGVDHSTVHKWLIYRKRALDGVPCAVPCNVRQATCGFNRQGSSAS